MQDYNVTHTLQWIEGVVGVIAKHYDRCLHVIVYRPDQIVTDCMDSDRHRQGTMTHSDLGLGAPVYFVKFGKITWKNKFASCSCMFYSILQAPKMFVGYVDAFNSPFSYLGAMTKIYSVPDKNLRTEGPIPYGRHERHIFHLTMDKEYYSKKISDSFILL